MARARAAPEKEDAAGFTKGRIPTAVHVQRLGEPGMKKAILKGPLSGLDFPVGYSFDIIDEKTDPITLRTTVGDLTTSFRALSFCFDIVDDHPMICRCGIHRADCDYHR
jgi:hypothetical protein